MPYEIIIKKTVAVKRVCGKEWKVVGTKEVDRDTRYYTDRENEPKTRIEDVYDYTPEIEKTVIEEREILKQTVDDMDLSAVIKAVNKL